MLFSSKKEGRLLSPCNGRAVAREQIPDEAFASGMLGDGFGIQPTDGEIRSPADGVVDSIAEGKHAYSLRTDGGLDVLVHVGVDTVEMKGEGFFPKVQKGERVKAGDVLADVSLEEIRARDFSDVVVVLVTNPERIGHVKFQYGDCRSGADAPMSFRILGGN